MFVEIEDAIVARLQARFQALETPLPAMPRVVTAADVAQAKDRSQGDSRVVVAYNGISGVNPLSGNPAVVTVSHQFYIWISTRSASRHGTGRGTRELADPIMVATLQALCGWRIGQGLPLLELTETPGPAYDEDGFGHYPLVFQYKTQVRGTI
jgi:hypothetical protein